MQLSRVNFKQEIGMVNMPKESSGLEKHDGTKQSQKRQVNYE